MIKIFSLFLILAAMIGVDCGITLQQYGQLQLQNPQNLLPQLTFSDATAREEHFPAIQKLIFLTPWNKKGFEYTLKYAHKLDYVSPCWYTLKIAPNGQPVFENQHNYDQTYANALRQTTVKLVPRVYVEGSDVNFFKNIGSDYHKFEAAVGLIERVVREKELDGIVWDTPFNFFEKERKQLNVLISQLLKAVRGKIGGEKVIMANMANPISHMNKLDIQQYNQLPVDFLLIQNYDSSDDYLAMLHSSIEWSSKIRPPIKVMLMLPFFSVKARVGPLSTEEAVRSLKRMGVATAEVEKGMCKFTEKKTKRVFLIPCFSYFKKAFELAQQAQASVGFWEGGNGMENYYKFL